MAVRGPAEVTGLRVFEAALACCAVEVAAALTRPLPPEGLTLVSQPEEADVLLVSGTVTNALAPAVRALYDRMPGPVRLVVSYGACANSGGPYWDSYAVTPGVAQVLPVDLYVPGCPPRPEALVDALLALHARPPDAGAPATTA